MVRPSARTATIGFFMVESLLDSCDRIRHPRSTIPPSRCDMTRRGPSPPVVLACALVMGGARPVRGQSAAAEPLTLRAAVARAVERAPSLAVSRHDIDEAAAGARG